MYYLNFTIDDYGTITFIDSCRLYFQINNGNIEKLSHYVYPNFFKLYDFSIDIDNTFDKEAYRHSVGYFEFKTDTISINDIEKSINDAIIKYVVDDNHIKHNCECKLSDFISNKQLVRDVKIDKVFL